MLTNKLMFILLFLISLTYQIQENSDTFKAEDMQQLFRISGGVPSFDNKYVVFASKQWNKTEGKSFTNLLYAPIDKPGEAKPLTSAKYGRVDSSPMFSESFKGFVFFLRTEGGKTSLKYKEFPSTDTEKVNDLTDYPLDITNTVILGKTLVFSTDMFYFCKSNMSCTLEENHEIEDRGPNSYQIYTRLMVRHWDQWYTQGKASHPFYQKLEIDNNKIVLVGEPIDMLANKMIQSPPIENGPDQFAISPDESLIAFSVLPRDDKMMENTSWDIYIFNVKTGKFTKIPRGKEYLGRCQSPLFSPDGTLLSMLCMRDAGVESDQLHVRIYDIQKKSFLEPGFEESFKPYISAYTWYKQTSDSLDFLLSVVEKGESRIYRYKFNQTAEKEEDVFICLTSDTLFYQQPIMLSDTEVLIQYSSFTFADKIGKLVYDELGKKMTLTELVDQNKLTLAKFDLQDAQTFTFVGGNNDPVQGWILNPRNFDKTKKYPLAFLVHGGPEGAWDPAWSYRWNPQLWAHHGYVVVMINPHGSYGMGIEFETAVRNNWGGVPFDDLMIGLDYVLKTYTYIDPDRVGACGASYGGFMMNWIQGHNDAGKFKCIVTHDGVFSTTTMFYATEEIWFPKAEYCNLTNIGCTPFGNNEADRKGFEQYSPEKFVANWKTPHLIIHGSKDYRIPVSEGISIFTALQMKGVPSRFVHFPDENHWVLNPVNSIKWYEEVLGWLDKYLDNY